MRAIFDIALELPGEGFRFYDRPLADGLRASLACECPSCAIIQYLAPDDDRVGNYVRKGVATMGHALHQMWAWQAFEGHDAYRVEAPIPWAHGVSHDDVLVWDGPWRGVYECKTHSDTTPGSPSTANFRQSEFRLRLREIAGLPLPGPMRIVMLGKAGNESGMVRGPWDVALTDERRAEIDATLSRIDSIMARAGTIDLSTDPELKGLGCTRCFPKPIVYAEAGLDDLLQEFGELRALVDEAEAVRKPAAAQKKTLTEQMEAVRAKLDPLIAEGVTVEGITHNATRTTKGTLVITKRSDAPDPVAPFEAVAS